ncbi:MAG: hypothetical protein P4L92_12940 [Rudaea sp.]|nr:hypothetical protein [Rudaea sp.]
MLADLAALAGIVLGLVGIASILVVRGGVYFSQWAPDVFIPLNGVLHIFAGQWPHRDFVTPVGSLWYAINALPALILPLTVSVTVWANLIIGVIAAVATFGVALGKIPRWMVCLCAFYTGLVALSPRQIGEGFEHISNNASYNRYCWSLICVIALAALLPSPHGTTRTRERVDGVVAGLLIAMCFYIKVTYAAAGFGFLGLALVTTRGLTGWRFAAWAVCTAVGTIAIAAIITGDLPGYLADLQTAVAVLPHTARTVQALNQLGYTMPGLLFVALAARLAKAGPTGLHGSFGPGAWAGVLTVVAGLAIEVQNHPEPECPLLPVALLIGWTASRLETDGPHRFSKGSGNIASCSFLVFVLVLDLCAVAWTAIAPVETGPTIAWLSGTQVTDLRIAAHYTGPEPHDRMILQIDSQIIARWNEAIVMLRPHLQGRHDVTVFPFMWSNPFPVMLGLRPVRHEIAWWDANRTFNVAHKPAPDAILDGVDYVLVPKDYVHPDTREVMLAAYGSDLQRTFTAVDHTAHWALWARRTCARRSLC